MLPARFEFHRPRALEEALELLERHQDDASPYAGGTELLIALKARVASFGHLVDIKRLAELKNVERRDDGGVSIGALATHRQLARDPVVAELLPGYAELSGNIANVRVRAAGTLGGNLCFAEPHADPPAMLCAFGAQMRLRSPRGERTLALEEFLLGELTTAREDDELLLRIDVPAQPAGTRGGYRAFGHLERPAVGVAVVAIPQGEGYRWRLRAGSLCGSPAPLVAAEQAMNGLPVEAALEVLGPSVEADAGEIDAHDDLQGSADYKRHLVTVLTRRAIRGAFGMRERP